MAFSYFFRDLPALELAVRHVGPVLAARSYPRIWDAGCAKGQEPYSLCILLAEALGHFAFNNLRIFASDLDDCEIFGPVITAASYPLDELQRMPPGILEKYFEPDSRPGHYRVCDAVRRCVTYRRHDLLSCEAIGAGFSLIVCKNVLLHFQPAERIQVIQMYHRALAAGGYFVTEQTQRLPSECAGLFDQVSTEAQLFRKRESSG